MNDQTTDSQAPTFGDLLRHHLEGAGISHAHAAGLWGMKPKDVKQLEQGATLPHTDRVPWWADVLDRPEHEIRAAIATSRARLGLPAAVDGPLG